MWTRRVLALLLVVASCLVGVSPALAAKDKGRTLSLPVARSFLSMAAETPGDVTGDGRADAVVRDPGPGSGTLRVYAHNGATNANPWTSFAPTAGEWDFADVLLLGDVNGDGRSDVVARDPVVGNGTLWIYPGDGDSWPSRYSAGTGWNRLGTLLLGDVTGDGLPDLLGREQAVASGTLWIYPHSGSTSTNPWTQPRIWAGTGWNLANVMLLADVTGDGFPEPVVRDGSGAAWVYPHNGTTNANPYTSRYFAGSGWQLARTLLIADATGDTRPDLVAIDAAGALWIYPHNGAGSGANPYTLARIAGGGGWTFANTFLAGDVTGDGRPDLLARLRAGDLWLYPNDGAPSPWNARVSAGSGWTYENHLLLGDVTGDGRPELIARDPADAGGVLWIHPHSGVSGGDPWTLPRVFGGSGWNLAAELLLGDLTGDGWRDVLVRDRVGDLWVYPHNRSGTGNPWTLAPKWAGSGWDTAADLALGDVTGDGVTDLVDLERDGTLSIYPTGGGAPVRVAGDWRTTRSIALADVTAAGRLDLVARDTSGALWIHPHSGATSGNPWPTRRSAGEGWGFASTLLF